MASGKKDPFEFKVESFSLRSASFLLLVYFFLWSVLIGLFFPSDALKYFTVILLVFTLPFIIFPSLYKTLRLYKIPIWMLRISSNKLSQKILSFLPFVALSGEWYIEDYSEQVGMKSLEDVVYFIGSQWYLIFFLASGFLAFVLRLTVLLRGSQSTSIIDIIAVLSIELTFVMLLIPILYVIYFVWIWVWKDAEIKIYSLKKSDMQTGDQEVNKLTNLWSASDSIRNLIGLVIGLPSITWLIETLGSDIGIATNTFDTFFFAFVFSWILFLFTGGLVSFMGVMYFRSGIHQEFVNIVRHEIKDNFKNSISVGLPYEFTEDI